MRALTSKSERISLRVDQVTNGILRAVARLESKTLSAFMLDSARTHAKRVVRDYERTIVRSQEFAKVLDELDRSPEVMPGLLHLAQPLEKEDAATA